MELWRPDPTFYPSPKMAMQAPPESVARRDAGSWLADEASADDVVNQALDYVFTKDKDFQQHLEKNADKDVPSALRVKKAPGSAKASSTAEK